MTESITVPRKVLEGIEAVRQTGVTNMLDRPVVAELAEVMGFEVAARWVRANPGSYARGVFEGFQIVGGNQTSKGSWPEADTGRLLAHRRLGNAVPKLTARVYSHIEVEDLRGAVVALPGANVTNARNIG